MREEDRKIIEYMKQIMFYCGERYCHNCMFGRTEGVSLCKFSDVIPRDWDKVFPD